MTTDLTLRLFAVWRRHMLVFSRHLWANLLTGFFEPLFYLVGFGIGVGRFVGELNGISYAAFIAPAIVASSAMYVASFECTYGCFLRLTYQRTYDAIVSTPVSVAEVAAGEMLFAATKALLSGTVILLSILTFRLVPGAHATAVLVPLAAFLTGLLFAALGMTLATLVSTLDHFSFYVSLVLMPMFVFSGVFFPVESLPAVARGIAWFVPLMHAARLCRELVLGGSHMLADLLWLAVATALLLLWPLALLRRKFRE